jgi:type 1 glutamine amidotransferase
VTGRALSLVALALSLLGGAAQAKPAAAHKKVLFFTKAAGNEHAVIKSVDGQPSLAQKILTELGEKNGFEVTHTKDGGVFTPEGIAKYDGFVFYTTGDLTTPGTDKNPPLPPGGKDLLLDSVRSKGKAFVGIHVAAATFNDVENRFADAGDRADPYIKMLGGEMIFHGQQQKARVFCADPKFPGFVDCKDSFELFEEWYSLKNLARDMHVILWMGTWSVMNTGKDSVYRRPPYPLAWARMHGKGRVFYTALGHRDDVWANPMFQTMLVGGIKWALGEARADLRSNLTAVTPHYADLPPNDLKSAPAAAATAKAPAAPVPARAP